MTAAGLLSDEDILSVTRDNFIETQDKLCFSQTLLDAHAEWEDVDNEWKNLLKLDRIPDSAVLKSAAKVRSAFDYKSALFDEAALLAERLSNKLGIIEEYTDTKLGKATIIDEVIEGSVEWLNMRHAGVGGSSIMEALGFHWKSRPGDPVYMKEHELRRHWEEMGVEKCTDITEVEDTMSGVFFRGHKWEPSLITRYALENNVRVAVSKATWKGHHDLQVVNVDGIVLNDKGKPVGLVECKTSSREWTWKWGVPMHYRAQVLWYLDAFGLDWADVVVKFDTGFIETHRVYRRETIDGTKRTKTIPEYFKTLENNWDKYIRPYQEDPDAVWNTGAPYAERYSLMDDVLPGVETNPHFIEVLESADVIKVDILSPYVRMSKKYDIVSGFETTQTDGKITFDSVSPVYYPVDNEYIFSDPQSRDDVFMSDYVTTDVVLAVDEPTYMYVTKYLQWPKVINASDLRRLIDVRPADPDFRSVSDVLSWLDSYLKFGDTEGEDTYEED